VNPHVLREYSLLADGHRGALVGPNGDISWMCAPGWHDGAVFAELVGGSGCFSVTPRGRFVWGGHYEGAGLIWRSRWVTEHGIVECREALAYPGDSDRVVLLRRVISQSGPAVVDVLLQPVMDFGADGMKNIRRDDNGCWTACIGTLQLRFSGGSQMCVRSVGSFDALEMELPLAEGDHHDFILEISAGGLGSELPDADRLWTSTETCWSRAVPSMAAGVADVDTRHSYSILRGLTAPGGGMVAAATLGLPERARAGRNYDYRYVWIRDQCYAGIAASVDEPLPLLDDAVSFVGARLLDDGPTLKPAYTTSGGPVPKQRSLSLPGYPGGSDIVGNHAGAQFQLDAFGEALQLFAAAARHDHLDSAGYRAMRVAVDAIAARWHEPDAGIWELENRRWAHSRLACAAGLRAAGQYVSADEGAKWLTLADRIVADTADCRHPSGRWQRAPDDDRVDAALLMPALRGAIPFDDVRAVSTLRQVAADLADDFYVYRFRHDDRPLHEAEGAFGLCGFLMALAVHQQGDTDLANRYFERNRAACGPPALFAEEYDVVQRQLRGNIPQAFVHALLIESALTLAKPPEAGRQGKLC